MRKFFFIITVALVSLSLPNTTNAQQYKLRQATSIMGMKTESTIYVKGMRKRTESGGMMGITIPTTIEQCDLQRTIKLNDKKKLYFIEPFAKEEVIDDDVKTATTKIKPVAPTTTQKGGVINMWYNISDTGERKKMNGFTARHVWTTQKMKPSADACMMKDSLIIKTDGWYIDLPEFNCPVRYTAPQMQRPTENVKPECQDRFVSHRSGKGKLGFPLTETRTIIMGNKGPQTSEFTTNLETIEFNSLKLDSMLFTIPPGYTQTMNEGDLQDKIDMKEMMNIAKNYKENNNTINPTDQKKSGVIRIGVYEPTGGEQLQASELQQYMAGQLKSGSIESIAISSEEDAKKYNCDYTLKTDFTRIKSASKVGGILKAIKNTDPNAASNFNIDATLTLISVANGSTKLQPKVSGKYEGKADDAAKKALDEGSALVLKGLK